MAKQLAEHFNTIYVPEYSRECLKDLGREYTYDDILLIARGQYESEQQGMRRAKDLLFCDTEFIVNKIWCEEKYGKCHSWILDMIDSHIYDLYLLCDIDLPWEPDPLRENPDDRDRLFVLYTEELENRNLPYEIISGSGKERLMNAIGFVEKVIIDGDV